MRPVPADVTSRRLENADTARAGVPRRATDAELLRAIGRGSEIAFDELRLRYQRAVERACRPIVGAEVEDCAQEVFARVWRKATLYDEGRGSAAAWLLTLARRVALNLRHDRDRPGRVTLTEVETAAVGPPEIDRSWLGAALERLPERERQVIELAYFGGLSQSRVAAELGVPLGSVKSWTRRGLNRMATLLGEKPE